MIPFQICEAETARMAAGLFRRAFRADPPAYPRHFLAIHPADKRVAAYVHYTQFEPGVYLIGGLCVDSGVYRTLSDSQRAELAERGSLSRWLLDASIGALGAKRAVFAYTGDIRSRRDVFALGFAATPHRFLLVQWHDEPAGSREELVRRVAAQGPF